jgi:hypothetical protein
MGADTWGDWAVWDGNGPVLSEAPGDRLSLAGARFFYPWDHTSRYLALPFIGRTSGGGWISQIATYDMSIQQERYRLNDAGAPGLVWSPSDEVVLLVGYEELQVIVGRGDRRRYVTASTDTCIFAAWVPSGSSFVVPAASSPGDPVSVHFHETGSGRVIAKEALDPRELVPFDEARLVEESRGRHLVHFVPSQTQPIRTEASSIDHMMHHWVDASYDCESASLMLATFRPTFELVELPTMSRPGRLAGRRPSPAAGPFVSFPPTRAENEPACLIVKQWVRVRFKD